MLIKGRLIEEHEIGKKQHLMILLMILLIIQGLVVNYVGELPWLLLGDEVRVNDVLQTEPIICRAEGESSLLCHIIYAGAKSCLKRN
jgi:hypothetical protein